MPIISTYHIARRPRLRDYSTRIESVTDVSQTVCRCKSLNQAMKTFVILTAAAVALLSNVVTGASPTEYHALPDHDDDV